MIAGIAVILACQLVGEVVARGLGLPVPGPVLGMALLFGVLMLGARVTPVQEGSAGVVPVGRFLLAHLSLLFVPAGVGVVGNLDVLAAEFGVIALALVISTLATLVVSVVTFRLVARLMGDG